MAKSPAERQAAYRARRNDGEGDRRLNTWISSSASLALDRLARRYDVTKRQMIERLAIDADSAILKTMEFDTAELNDYLNVTP